MTNDRHVRSSDGTPHVEVATTVKTDKFLVIEPVVGLGTRWTDLNVRYTLNDFVSLHRHVSPTWLLLYTLLSVLPLEAGVL
jgi:hypothetical protein